MDYNSVERLLIIWGGKSVYDFRILGLLTTNSVTASRHQYERYPRPIAYIEDRYENFNASLLSYIPGGNFLSLKHILQMNSFL